MTGTAWILIDLIAPVAALLVLVVLIITARPGPERVPYGQSAPEPERKDKDSRTRRRGRRTRIDGAD